MRRNAFQEQCAEFARRFAAARILDRSGQRVRPGCLAETLRRARSMSWSAGAGLALLSDPDWWLPHQATASDLRALALGYLDAWARSLKASSRGDEMPPDFDMIGFGPAFQVLSSAGPSTARVNRWRDAMACAADCTARFLLRKEAAWGKPGPFTGTGPNHLFLFGASLYRFGHLLGEGRWTALAKREMRALCDLQADEGYFPEDVGPAGQYHRVSLFGLCDYAAASGDEVVEPHVVRGIRFLVRSLYPDLSSIETFDQRNRTTARAGAPGRSLCAWSLAFGQSPLGWRLAHLMLARALERLRNHPADIRQGILGMAALGALSDSRGSAATRLPCERPVRVDRFDGLAAVLQRDRWCVALSGYYQSNRPGNPFILERTQAVSVFEERAGLVIGGGNDKHRLDAATFDLVESGYVHYFPPIGGRVRAAGRRAVLDLDYGAAQARLTAAIPTRGGVDLVAGAVTNFAHQVNRFNLQIPVGPGATVVIDGRPVRLSVRSERPRRWPVRHAIEVAGVRIEPDGGAEFHWPHRPWNSYSIPTHESPLSAATGFLRVPLTGHDLAERIVRLRC